MTEAQWTEALSEARREGDAWALVELARVALSAA